MHDVTLSTCILQVEPCIQVRQGIESAGFVTYLRQEQLVTSAVIAA